MGSVLREGSALREGAELSSAPHCQAFFLRWSWYEWVQGAGLAWNHLGRWRALGIANWNETEQNSMLCQ